MDDTKDEAIETVTDMLIAATELEEEDAARLARKIVVRVAKILDEEAEDGDEEEEEPG